MIIWNRNSALDTPILLSLEFNKLIFLSEDYKVFS